MLWRLSSMFSRQILHGLCCRWLCAGDGRVMVWAMKGRDPGAHRTSVCVRAETVPLMLERSLRSQSCCLSFARRVATLP